MLPGNSRILTCPFCNGEKEVMSLLSGNTLEATYWSDTKVEAPMNPQVSFVQKCPHCGKYFLLSSQNENRYGHTITTDLGTLTYDEMKEALQQLDIAENIRQPKGIQLSWRFTLLWVANDNYGRKGKEIPEEDRKLIDHNIKMITLELTDNDQLLQAELLRETGYFKRAIELAEEFKQFSTLNEVQQYITDNIVSRAKAEDTKVFKIL